MTELRLRVYRVDHKCIDTDGCWDGTWDDSYEWEIYDEEGFTIDGMDGYHTEDAARIAGEMRLKILEERK